MRPAPRKQSENKAKSVSVSPITYRLIVWPNVCVCTFADDRRVGRVRVAYIHIILEVFCFFSSIFLSPSLHTGDRPTPTSPLIIARKSEFIHTRAITYITHAHTNTRARMKRFWEKKLTPPLALIPLPWRWCLVLRATMGIVRWAGRQKRKKKFRLSRTRAESNPQLPRIVVRGPDSSSFFVPVFVFVPPFHANNS